MSSDRRGPSPHLVDTSAGAARPLERESADATIAEARAVVADYVSANCAWVPVQGVVLVVSELVSNAVRHAGGWWRLRVEARETALILEIEDLSPVLPTPREPDLSGDGGLGLHIVERLVSGFEVEPGVPAGGKTVRAVWLREADEDGDETDRLTARAR